MTCPAPIRRPPPEPGPHGEPTGRQLEVLAYVHLHQLAFRRAPSTYEFCVRFGWSSTGAPADYLMRLAAHGLLESPPRIAHGLPLTASGKAAATEYLRTHRLELRGTPAVNKGATP
ncbi:hypothetical protein [Myxococcus virescens]|uniref:LexA repressor DNA-binding domain-containing protein n=1 Tax=Myxococcus virescens TaxID=83456 RepID=A0A511HP64_9BACT|nr:hypothetical protein [Myxococcus virescens]GEL75174.1 hypothetical protein MVI01_69580 [Myxococcus virescens]SDD64490.1 hypothetical protein SAMN04488504_10299 [Myxococcus virescens]